MFFATAAASAAYLMVSEVFPMEVRAMVIALFYAIATGLGGITGPVIFGQLIGTGDRSDLLIGFAIAASLMIAAVNGVDPGCQGRAEVIGERCHAAQRHPGRDQLLMGKMIPYPKKVLLATNGTKDSARAAHAAVALAGNAGAELHVVHVGQNAASVYGAEAAGGRPPGEPPGYAERTARKLLDRQAEQI